MYLDPNDIMFGLPVLRVRAIVRFAMQKRFSGTKGEIQDEIVRRLKMEKSAVRNTIHHLLQEEYMVWQQLGNNSKRLYVLESTDKGRRFGISKANPPISREKAEVLLLELIERAKEINGNSDLVYYVARLKVFGSYLSDKKVLGDLDVGYKLEQKYVGNEITRRSNQRIELALKMGRHFRSSIEKFSWPRREVEKFLRTRKKGLSLHDEESDGVVNKTENREVYKFEL